MKAGIGIHEPEFLDLYWRTRTDVFLIFFFYRHVSSLDLVAWNFLTSYVIRVTVYWSIESLLSNIAYETALTLYVSVLAYHGVAFAYRNSVLKAMYLRYNARIRYLIFFSLILLHSVIQNHVHSTLESFLVNFANHASYISRCAWCYRGAFASFAC